MAEKSKNTLMIVPSEDGFKPAPILFGVVTGEGVPDFDNQKSKGKRGGFDYTVTLALSKKEDKAFRKAILEFWEANKPKDGEDEPANFKNITRPDKEDEDTFLFYAKTKVEFETKDGTARNVVPIVNHEGTKLDPEEFGNIGKGSKGRVAIKPAIYGDDEDAGISLYLSAVKLTEFVPFTGSNAANAFGSEEGSVDGAGGFKSESSDDEPKKKKKKKKKEK